MPRPVHEFAFADLTCQERYTILELPMRDFTVGHRLILLRQRNPLLWQPAEDFKAETLEYQKFWLRSAVTVCSLPMFPAWLTRFKWRRANRRANRKTRKLDRWGWVREVKRFREYLDKSRIITDFDLKKDGCIFLPTAAMPESDGRETGGPHDATLIQFLIRELVLPYRVALDFPFAQAEAHYLVWLEKQGALRILNRDETEFKEQNALRNLEAAKAAGFKTAKEHFEFELAKAKKERSATIDRRLAQFRQLLL